MKKIRTHQKISSNDIHIDGLEKYKGLDAEIIIVVETPSKTPKNKKKALAIIQSYTGSVSNWNRDELYER